MKASAAVAAALVSLVLVSAASAVPEWYWQWAKWRLGHDEYRCHAGDTNLRPAAPRPVPGWAWDRLEGQTARPCVKSSAVPTAARPASVPLPQAPAAPVLDSAELALRDALNSARQANGLSELSIDPRLQRAARERTGDLAAYGYFAHEWHDGTPFATWITRYWLCGGAGEILVMRTPSLNAQQAVQLWLASPGHRANILSPDWRTMGVELSGIYGTVDFGGPC